MRKIRNNKVFFCVVLLCQIVLLVIYQLDITGSPVNRRAGIGLRAAMVLATYGDAAVVRLFDSGGYMDEGL